MFIDRSIARRLETASGWRSVQYAQAQSVLHLADPSLQDELHRMRYRLKAFYNVLSYPLAQPLPGPADPEVRVAPVEPRDKGLWLKTVGQGFSSVEDPPDDILESLAPGLYSPDTRLFLAWIGGEAVGGGALSEHGGIVELGAGSTRPGFRRKGVQAALIRARLAAARELGCDLAMIVTKPGSDSQRNAQRLGFHLAYTKAVMMLDRHRRPGLQAG